MVIGDIGTVTARALHSIEYINYPRIPYGANGTVIRITMYMPGVSAPHQGLYYLVYWMNRRLYFSVNSSSLQTTFASATNVPVVSTRGKHI